MVLEIVVPIGIAVVGGIGSAVVGAYRNTKDKEEKFNEKHFVMSIPRSIVGAVLALAVGGGSWDIGTLTGILGIFAVGFTANQVLGKLWGANDKEE